MDQMYSDVVIAIVTALCGYIVWLLKDIRKTAKAKDEREEKEKQANRKGTRCLLRQQIIDYHDKYIERGEISPHGYENLLEMAEAYEALGGNGKVKKMALELKELPIREQEEKS